MSDLLQQLYYMTFELSPRYKSEEYNVLDQKLETCLGKENAGLLEAYDAALYRLLEQEDQAFFLRTLALGMELGRLSVS